MGRAASTLVFVLLLAVPAALADDPPAVDDAPRLDLLVARQGYYEKMLRDAKTETAAQYFVARLEEILRQIADAEEELAQVRAREAAVEAPPLTGRVDEWLRARIGNRVQAEDTTLSDVAAWTRRELPEELMAMLATWLGREKRLSPDEAIAAWEARERKGWLTASYGAGTFIVRPPSVKALRRDRAGAADGPRIALPRPPTRDQWWASAGAKQRADWIMAFFVENSGLFELDGSPPTTVCVMCNGEGLITKTLRTGARVTYLCTRCGGARHDVALRYR